MFEMKDSGQRETFSTGAIREEREDKGRFDLVTPIGIRRVLAMPDFEWWAHTMDEHLLNVIGLVESYIEGYRDEDYLALAARDLLAAIEVDESAKAAKDTTLWIGTSMKRLSPVGMRRVAIVYEKGARKYANRNWEKGMPMGRFLDSALRHTFQALEGKRDEDHLAHAAWNILATMHVEEMIERGLLPSEYNDLPCFLQSQNAQISLSTATAP